MMEYKSLFVGLIGIIFLIIYLVQRDKLKLYRKLGVKTQGTVTDLIAEGRNRMYHPVVRFTLADGYHVNHKSSFGSRPSLFTEGEAVELLYLPEKPEEFIIISKNSEKLHIVFMIIGVLAFGYFLFTLVKDYVL
ncbi:MAG TPA: DUF3592 domain-containing protein [Pedobacter sp.]|nr:DUF3592 domain-containing protein [Pedobacter sp.]